MNILDLTTEQRGDRKVFTEGQQAAWIDGDKAAIRFVTKDGWAVLLHCERDDDVSDWRPVKSKQYRAEGAQRSDWSPMADVDLTPELLALIENATPWDLSFVPEASSRA